MGPEGRARETTQKANPPIPALPATEPCSQISTSPKQSVCDILANIIFKNVETDKCRENLNSASVVLPKYSDNKITITSTGEMKTMHMSEVVGLGGRGPTFALGRPRAPLADTRARLWAPSPSHPAAGTSEHVLDPPSLRSLGFERNVSLQPVTEAQVEVTCHEKALAGREVPRGGSGGPRNSPAASPGCLGLTPVRSDLASICGKQHLWGGFEIPVILLQDLKEAVGILIILMKGH